MDIFVFNLYYYLFTKLTIIYDFSENKVEIIYDLRLT